MPFDCGSHVSRGLGWRALAARRFRAAVEQAKNEIAAGQYGRAQLRLLELAGHHDLSGEVDYQLGICEVYRGHPDQASAAWQRVRPGGPFGAKAALQLGMLAMSSGQLTRAEEILQKALDRGAGGDAQALLSGLQLLFHLEGRTEDVRRAIIASWAESSTPEEVVRQLVRLSTTPLPLETARNTLAKADKDDDRAWLARQTLRSPRDSMTKPSSISMRAKVAGRAT